MRVTTTARESRSYLAPRLPASSPTSLTGEPHSDAGRPRMLLSGRALALASSLAAAARALTPTEWRRQSIYQVLTDRFALTDLSTTAACDTSAQVYCGGTWQGLIQKLDYIQGMGFTAVWISPMVEQMIGNTSDG